MKISCIIVDDEPLSRDVLIKYISNTPQLELKTTLDNAISAMDYLNKNQVDLIFLDINMPKLSGVSLVKSLLNPPLIIFTTAYPQFAVEGFELDAVDYLLKPFSFERFLKAVNKVSDKLSKTQNLNQEQNYLVIKADKKLHRIRQDEILYIESAGDYVKIFFGDQMIMAHETMKNLEQTLPSEMFYRTHRSYIVALDKITFIEGNQLKITEAMIPVSPDKKEELLKIIQER
jgi:DNA-binding LytR/AlgR family response regulator